MDLSGWVLVGLTLIVLGYLVPHLTRSQAVAAESRVADRFSPKLRLVKPVQEAPRVEQGEAARVSVHPPEIARRRTEALAMIRPTAPDAHRVNARELAAARASRAAAISRRAAAGRRRMLLSGLLVVASALAWVMVGGGVIGWGWAVPMTLLAGGTAYLAVQRAVVDRRADVRARVEMARLDQRLRLFRTEEAGAPAVSGEPTFAQIMTPYRGAHAESVGIDEEAAPKHARVPETSLVVELGEAEEVGRPMRAADDPLPVEGGPEWTPVPVPLPTYTLKAEVPRREATAWEAGAAPSARVPERPVGAAPTRTGGEEEEDAQTFVLEDVLARRRVAGG